MTVSISVLCTSEVGPLGRVKLRDLQQITYQISVGHITKESDAISVAIPVLHTERSMSRDIKLENTRINGDFSPEVSAVIRSSW
jgi:hypothetical protein